MPDKTIKSFEIFQSLSVEIVGWIIVTFMLFPLFLFFKKLPKIILQRFYEKRNERVIHRDYKISVILEELKLSTKAAYVQIIKYHDTNKPINTTSKLNTTVIWEIVGQICKLCPHNKNGYKLRRLQTILRDQPCTTEWIKIIRTTISDKDKVNTVCQKDLSDVGQEIWDIRHTNIYKEIYLSHKSLGIFVLGVSFCKNSVRENADGKILVAAGELKRLL